MIVAGPMSPQAYMPVVACGEIRNTAAKPMVSSLAVPNGQYTLHMPMVASGELLKPIVPFSPAVRNGQYTLLHMPVVANGLK